MTRIDYYQILETHPQANQDEIRAAYRKAAQKHHPDKNKGSQTAEEKFKALEAAGVRIARSPGDLGKTMAEILR